VFMETHQDPDHAPSDGPNMLHLHDVPALLDELVAIDRIAKSALASQKKDSAQRALGKRSGR
jgi:3-deoxy-D-manno-octulosonic acid (KDO) 8-phosphate synthase